MGGLQQVLVLADLREIIGIVMALLLTVMWVVKQISDAGKQGKGPEEAQPMPRQPERPVPRQAAGQQADPLRDQVEEFLRRAGRGPQGERARPGPRDIELLLDDEPADPQPIGEPMRPIASRPGTPPPPPVAAAPMPAQGPPQRPGRRPVTPRKRKTLAERATERAQARAGKLAQQTSHLGQRIIEDDAQFDVQLKAKFDHTIGTLAGSAATAVTSDQVPVDSPAGQIAAMLASPEGVRQAIVLNEILRRPSDPW
jgi:hypothetical protein